MRIRTTTAAVVAVLAITTAGCGSSGGKADGKPAASSTPSPTSSADRDSRYLHAAQDIPFTSHRPTDDELLAYPPKWCAGLDDGHSAAWLFSGGGGGLYPVGMDWGTVKRNAYRLLVAGVRAYCPEHEDAVTAELRASGEY